MSHSKGYGAFSVSSSNVSAVTRYIDTQGQHHRRRSYQQEFKALLDKHVWNTTRNWYLANLGVAPPALENPKPGTHR